MWMKLVKNELFMEKSWAKIVVGISFYRCKTKLVVGSKSGWNLTIGSSYSRWGSILAVESHSDSIWTIRCTWNWPLELRPNLDSKINARKLGAIGSEDQGSRCRRWFFWKNGRYKPKFRQLIAVADDFLKISLILI